MIYLPSVHHISNPIQFSIKFSVIEIPSTFPFMSSDLNNSVHSLDIRVQEHFMTVLHSADQMTEPQLERLEDICVPRTEQAVEEDLYEDEGLFMSSISKNRKLKERVNNWLESIYRALKYTGSEIPNYPPSHPFYSTPYYSMLFKQHQESGATGSYLTNLSGDVVEGEPTSTSVCSDGNTMASPPTAPRGAFLPVEDVILEQAAADAKLYSYIAPNNISAEDDFEVKPVREKWDTVVPNNVEYKETCGDDAQAFNRCSGCLCCADRL
jgi:hypothetical protein